MAKFVPRQRKHKRERHEREQELPGSKTAGPANAEVILPLAKNEKEERRLQLQADLRAQQPISISSKKKKRLDKYIDTKLKKEENLELLKKLAAQKVDTGLLQSAKKLGQVRESKRERFSRALRERAAGLDIDGQQDAVLYQPRKVMEIAQIAEDSDDESEGPESVTEDATTVQTTQQPPSSFGNGLKRPLETDDAGKPVIKRRKRRKMEKKLVEHSLAVEDDNYSLGPPSADSGNEQKYGDESEWNGFDSDEQDEDLASQRPEDTQDSDEESEPLTESDQSSDDEDSTTSKPARVSAFKAWADSQRDRALGFIPSTAPISDEKAKAAFVPRAPSPDPVASDLVSTATNKDAYRPSATVLVSRSEEIQASRLDLPVVQDEQKIMEAINNNPVTIVCGATGSGKTTQLPQMLLESGYASIGMIGVTQPRRVAATSVASRVAHELGPDFGKQVAHQVRFDSNVGRETKIKFMTDGILLREISEDFALSKYSAVVIDEAHERSVNTDILIGMLSRLVPLRQQLSREKPESYHPLKLIIMSATLRVADFLLNERLFKSNKPPIVQAEGRQHQVTEHFARRTQRDYVAETVSKVSRGHRKLPAGSILVFLTGQDEISTVAKRLKEEFTGDITSFRNSKARYSSKTKNDYLEGDGDNNSDSEAEITGLDDDDQEFEVAADPGAAQLRGPLKAHILPFYAALPSHEQKKVFQPPPEGSRAIILATNVAETSLTIPGVRYVFDCGRSKEKRYDSATGIQEFQIDWISKASASQRMGRAGRTGPGHCYRLYSSAIYEQYFETHSTPEILRVPIEGTVLQLKNMNITNLVNFPFPTPPQAEQLVQAEKLLQNLGAINPRTGKVTSLGKKLIHYPVNPRFAKMLLLGKENNVLSNMIAVVAGLAGGELFLPEPQLVDTRADYKGDSSEDDAGKGRSDRSEDAAAKKRRQNFGRVRALLSARDDKSDALTTLTAVALHAQAKAQGDEAVLSEIAGMSQIEIQSHQTLCDVLFLRQKAMDEVQSLRRLLHESMVRQGHQVAFKPTLDPPTPGEASVLSQLVACGYLDQVAIRADLLTSIGSGRPPRRANEVAYRTLLPSITEAELDRSAPIQDQYQQQSVFVHSGSVLAKLSLAEMPSYIIYSHLSRATAKTINGKSWRTRIHPLTTIALRHLAKMAEGTPLLGTGKPIGKIEFKELGKKRECWVPISLQDPNAPGDTLGWALGSIKVRQVMEGKEWVIEEVLQRAS